MKACLFISALLYLSPTWLAAATPDQATHEKAMTSEALVAKLKQVVIPRVKFEDVPLSKALEGLSGVLETFCDGEAPWLQIKLDANKGDDPLVNIEIRDQSLDRILYFVSMSVGYSWEIKDGVVVVAPLGTQPTELQTIAIPISRATVIGISFQ